MAFLPGAIEIIEKHLSDHPTHVSYFRLARGVDADCLQGGSLSVEVECRCRLERRDPADGGEIRVEVSVEMHMMARTAASRLSSQTSRSWIRGWVCKLQTPNSVMGIVEMILSQAKSRSPVGLWYSIRHNSHFWRAYIRSQRLDST